MSFLKRGTEARAYLRVIKVVRKRCLRMLPADWLAIRSPVLAPARLVRETQRYLTYDQDYLPEKVSRPELLLRATWELFSAGWWLHDIYAANWRMMAGRPVLIDYHSVAPWHSDTPNPLTAQRDAMPTFLLDLVRWRTARAIPKGTRCEDLGVSRELEECLGTIRAARTLCEASDALRRLCCADLS